MAIRKIKLKGFVNHELLGPQHSFEVKFARDIMQQESDSLSVLYPPNFTYIFHSIDNVSFPFGSAFHRSTWKSSSDLYAVTAKHTLSVLECSSPGQHYISK
ncbi:hypothetical protein H5410_048359 [Solanum commersonii]|uniref:Uncharacterized protein n=1 Tax=Solanum commersonii TaxID=4109 RepID=A0A9J5XJG9_SOLCO|nr:hypothetical protein H5410_048359 [Solanum commersonii]